MAVNSPASVPDKNALVVDFLGRVYVAVHSGYSSSSFIFYRVLVWRIFVAVLASAVFALCVAGQVVQTYSWTSDRSSEYYTLWRVRTVTASSDETTQRYEPEMQAVGALSAALAFVAAVMSTVPIIVWLVLERQRRAEEETYAQALDTYGQRRTDQDGATNTFPFTNTCVENRGQVASVPCEERELHRRTYDKNFTIVTLVVLILAGVFILTSMGLMVADWQDFAGSITYSGANVGPGIPLYIVATGLSLVAIVIIAIPQMTRARLCGGLRPTRCSLMVVDEAVAGDVGEEIRRLMAHGNPLLAGVMTGVPVALPGPPIEAMRSMHQQSQQQQQQQQHQPLPPNGSSPTHHKQEKRGDMAASTHGYCSADYYEAPPQLFRVCPDPTEGEAEVPRTRENVNAEIEMAKVTKDTMNKQV